MRNGDIKPLSDADQRHLLAPQGWLEPGNQLEADSELDQIEDKYRIHAGGFCQRVYFRRPRSPSRKTKKFDTMIMKIALVTFCLSVFCGFIRAETMPPERKVQANSLISTRDPNIRIDVPASASYVGANRWILYGVADCEVHVFIQADEKKIVKSLYWVQFEGYLPEKPDQRYDYTKDRNVVIDGLEFHLKGRFGPTSEKPKPGSDLEHVLKLIAGAGYKLPPDMMNIRLVYLPDSSHRKELMVIYAEDMATTGNSSTNLMAGEKIRSEWAGVEKALIERAKKQIRFRLQK